MISWGPEAGQPLYRSGRPHQNVPIRTFLADLSTEGAVGSSSGTIDSRWRFATRGKSTLAGIPPAPLPARGQPVGATTALLTGIG